MAAISPLADNEVSREQLIKVACSVVEHCVIFVTVATLALLNQRWCYYFRLMVDGRRPMALPSLRVETANAVTSGSDCYFFFMKRAYRLADVGDGMEGCDGGRGWKISKARGRELAAVVEIQQKNKKQRWRLNDSSICSALTYSESCSKEPERQRSRGVKVELFFVRKR